MTIQDQKSWEARGNRDAFDALEPKNRAYLLELEHLEALRDNEATDRARVSLGLMGSAQ